MNEIVLEFKNRLIISLATTYSEFIMYMCVCIMYIRIVSFMRHYRYEHSHFQEKNVGKEEVDKMAPGVRGCLKWNPRLRLISSERVDLRCKE